MSSYPRVVKEAIDRGVLDSITRRIEVYESDGVTPWQDALTDRLVDGSVGVAYGDNERRTLDLTLRNDDNLLRSAPTGFWYDKVIKLYRGVKYSPDVVTPGVAIIDSVGGLNGSGALIAWLARIGLPGARYFGNTVTAGQLQDYDIIVSYTGSNAATSYGQLLSELYASGKNVVTIGINNREGVIPFFTATTGYTGFWSIEQVPTPPSLGAGWTTEVVGGSVAGWYPSGLSPYATQVARSPVTQSTWMVTASAAANETGGRWFDLRLPALGGAQVAILMTNVVKWFKSEYGNWETQIGEFVIDGISTPHFPSNVKVTGRDYTKRALNSKLENAMSFDAGTTVGMLVTALAANSGITKMRLGSMPETIGSTMSFDRGTPRWEVMGAAARTQGYEIYFDHEGYLTTRKYLDPTTSPENYVFKTGPEGNLASIDRAVNDTRIYNHIVVYGDPTSGETRLPFIAEVKNENPSSPTRMEKLGDRYYSYASTFFTSQQQCQDYAVRLLRLHALESFELSFQAINYPWLEVGEIARVEDPKAVASDPTKYLVDSATIPLGLGPMSFTGKRVVIV